MSVGAEIQRRGRLASISSPVGFTASESFPPILSLPCESLVDDECTSSQIRRSSGINERATLSNPSKLLQRDETTVNELLHFASAVNAEDLDEEVSEHMGTDEETSAVEAVNSGSGSTKCTHSSSGQTLFRGPEIHLNVPRSRVSSPTMPARTSPTAAPQNIELVR